MIINPRTKQAYQLMHDGTIALARAERAGIRLDLALTNRKKTQLSRRIERIETDFMNSDFTKHWKKLRGSDININSGKQLGEYLYNDLNLTPFKTTPSGAGSTDEEALTALNIKELNDLIHSRKLKKMMDYLDLFLQEQVDEYIHPVFNLHFARTYRSSSDSPNFQNIPKRDKEAMKITRGVLFPRPGHQLLEVDYGSLEVRIAACYHNDSNMIKYLNDPSSDMHGDMACQIFKMDEIDKGIPSHNTLRQAAKNTFVFPQFYGDYYKNNAVGLCEWAQLPQTRWKESMGIELPVESISSHLIRNGIKSFNAFVEHVKEIEKDFWQVRFAEYARWKERWWDSYQKYGYIDMKTGFRCSGVMSRNDAINYPVQGAAFHCLLWSFIKLDEISQEEEWDSRLIGQIHDSIIIDALPDEVEYIKKVVQKVTCEDLPKAWDWITIPLEIDIDIHPVDGSWAD